MASMAAARGAAVARPENTARSPMLFSRRNVGRWFTCNEWNSAVVARARASKSPEVEARARATTAEFHSLQVNQRPTFLLENSIGDRAVFSGLATAAPLAAAIDAMLNDAAAYASHAAHFGPPPAG